MTFDEAVHSMIMGKRMIRAGWAGFYLTILHGQNYICLVGKGSMTDPGVSNYIPSVDDLTAADWICKTN